MPCSNAFNRTIVELKYNEGSAGTADNTTFNRTIVELKLELD